MKSHINHNNQNAQYCHTVSPFENCAIASSSAESTILPPPRSPCRRLHRPHPRRLQSCPSSASAPPTTVIRGVLLFVNTVLDICLLRAGLGGGTFRKLKMALSSSRVLAWSRDGISSLCRLLNSPDQRHEYGSRGHDVL